MKISLWTVNRWTLPGRWPTRTSKVELKSRLNNVSQLARCECGYIYVLSTLSWTWSVHGKDSVIASCAVCQLHRPCESYIHSSYLAGDCLRSGLHLAASLLGSLLQVLGDVAVTTLSGDFACCMLYVSGDGDVWWRLPRKCVGCRPQQTGDLQ